MARKFLEIRFERNLIESYIYDGLRKECPYMSGGEAQRLARIFANKLCGEWRDQIELAKDFKRANEIH
jgi:hypothetical protein